MKITKLIIVVFAFLGVLSFAYFAKPAHAQYITDTECDLESFDAGSHIEDFNLSGNGVNVQYTDSTTRDLGVVVYKVVDGVCNIDAANGGTGLHIVEDVGQYEIISVEYTDSTHYRIRNETTNTDIATDIIGTNELGIQVLIYELTDSVNQRNWSTSFRYSANDPPIAWNSNFYNYRFTPDFDYWQVKLNVAGLSINDYYYTVAYGETNPTDYLDTSATREKSSLRLDSLAKANDLVPDSYVAVARLYDGNDNLIHETPTISFTITAGDKIYTPVGTAPSRTENISTVKEQANQSCLEVPAILDIAGVRQAYIGACKFAVFLVYPEQETIDEFYAIPENLQTHAPFSYFYEVKTMFESIETEATEMPEITFEIGGALPVEATVFSEDSIDTYTSGGFSTKIRTAIGAMLWFGFIMLVIYEWRKLFHKQQ